MEKRIKRYLEYLKNTDIEALSDEEARLLKKEILIQISFFAHERQIHLFVTLTFALLTVLSLIAAAMAGGAGFIALTLLLLVLLIPYIRHYYILENSVQKMYGYYDRIAKKCLRDPKLAFENKEK